MAEYLNDYKTPSNPTNFPPIPVASGTLRNFLVTPQLRLMPNLSVTKKYLFFRYLGPTLPLTIGNFPAFANALKVASFTVPGGTGANAQTTWLGGANGQTPGGTLQALTQGATYYLVSGATLNWALPNAAEVLQPVITSLSTATVTAGDTLTITGTGLNGITFAAVGGASAYIDPATQTATSMRITIPLLSSIGTGILLFLAGLVGCADNSTLTVTGTSGGGTAPAGSYVLLFEGHSRFADERPRYYGDGSGPYTGYLNPAPTRVATALSGNAQYVFPKDANNNPTYNFATSGDDLGTARINGAVERGEVVANMVAGKVNILALHDYINNIHAGILAGNSPATVTASTKAAIQSYLTNIKSDATAQGVTDLRIIQLTEPSTYPTGNQFAFTVQQATDAQQCVSDVRDWILTNRASLGIFVVADLCSQPLFFGRDVPKTSQYYQSDQVHYSPAGAYYVAFSFLIPAIQMAAANTQGVVDYTTAPPVASGDPDAQFATSTVATTQLDDQSADITYTSFQTSSETGIDPGAGYYLNTTRFTQQTPPPTTAMFAITKRFAGTSQEGIDYYGFNDVGARYRFRVDGGAWSAYTTFVRPTINNGVGRYLSLRGFAAGTRLIEVEISKTDGSPLAYGAHSLDKIDLISRVPQ